MNEPSLRSRPPSNRSYAQLLKHYEIEKNLATRLKQSRREERTAILNSMYDELFEKVPDHPRLVRRNDEAATERYITSKMALLGGFLPNAKTYLEFAPGDCRFAKKLSGFVEKAYGVDVSDQRNPTDVWPENFELIVYDGYDLPRLLHGRVDLVFSDQLIEHIHPEDTQLHFELASRVLRKGGAYVFRTPHAQTGPHDISRYFSDEPEGFHLKEWTYVDMERLVKASGFSSFLPFRCLAGRCIRMPIMYFRFVENLVSYLGHQRGRPYAQALIGSLYGAAIK
jgi:SAM-dependent methyltransferase